MATPSRPPQPQPNDQGRRDNSEWIRESVPPAPAPTKEVNNITYKVPAPPPPGEPPDISGQ